MPSPNQPRRLAAVLFTDMVGYSALCQRSENLAARLLEEHRRMVRAALPGCGGREVETTGDGFLLEFPTASQAVQFGIVIQQRQAARNATVDEAQRFQFRVGVHLGEVQTTEKNITGDGVNIAARIEPLSPHGGLAISAAVHSLIRNKIEAPFRSIGTPQMKNIAEVVEVLTVDAQAIGLLPEQHSAGRARRGLTVGTSRVVIGAAAVVVIAVAVAMFARPRAAGHGEVAPIAIIPCDNLSGDAALDIFAEAIVEELGSRLSSIRELAIIGRRSSQAFKGKPVGAAEIGHQLGAGYVLTCSVRKLAQGVRFSAQLVDTSSSVEEWSQSYDREPDATMTLTDEVAVSIADAVLPELVGPDRARLIRHNTNNPRALEAYLRGIKALQAQTLEAINRATSELEEAIRLDPGFAAAYGSLALTYNERYRFEPGMVDELRQKAFANSAKALELDPSMPEARVAADLIRSTFQHDYRSSRRQLNQALQQRPNSVFINVAMASYLFWYGPFEEAYTYAAKAHALDPVNQQPLDFMIMASLEARQFDRCLADSSLAMAKYPEDPGWHQWEGLCLLGLGRNAEGLQALQRLGNSPDRTIFYLSYLAYAHAVNGNRAEALRLVEQARTRARAEGAFPDSIYVAYAGLGDKDKALEELEAGFATGTDWVYLEYHRFFFDSMRNDPRFIAIGRKHGLNPDGTLINPDGT
jgi:adenylate cyclase